MDINPLAALFVLGSVWRQTRHAVMVSGINGSFVNISGNCLWRLTKPFARPISYFVLLCLFPTSFLLLLSCYWRAMLAAIFGLLLRSALLSGR
ncbi:hypothetical protein KJI95_11295 [Shewanella sp. JM162201]|uniref:Uncharacterized protein n=1 Tax=Shewanella jiangmenensis TaxID=2837387 RepID=A0ABS5V3S0_9GAMM|nr:hypothetical protein [Shewanella jiangmenensis]MBT1445105.1 hypothetical protein [Shewanella jiangmenensis]